jgi:hypothetical protein
LFLDTSGHLDHHHTGNIDHHARAGLARVQHDDDDDLIDALTKAGFALLASLGSSDSRRRRVWHSS